MNDYGLLKELCELSAPTGGEDKLAALLMEKLQGRVDVLTKDVLGNVTAIKKSKIKDAERVILDAHMDEIAAIVTEITDEGFARIDSITGIDARVMLAAEVTIHGREEVFGVVSCRPPHLTSSEERKKVPDVGEMVVDIGFSAERAKEKIAPGDLVTLRANMEELSEGVLCSKAFDNRTGVAIILEVFERLEKEELPFDLVMFFSIQEESGLRGAKSGGSRLNADEAIILDVTFGDDMGTKEGETGIMGAGPMIGISPILNRALFKKLCAVAKEEKIPYQIEVMSAGTGTDADMLEISGRGVAAATVSLPIRNMHTAVEVVWKEDYEAVCALVDAYLRKRGEKR